MKKIIALLVLIAAAAGGIWYAGREPPPAVALHTVSRGMGAMAAFSAAVGCGGITIRSV